MNRDAKIGVVVVLIIVGVLVIIWARGEREEAMLTKSSEHKDPVLLENNLSPSERGDRPPGSGGSAAERESDFFRDSTLVLPSTSETATASASTPTTSTMPTMSNPANPATGTGTAQPATGTASESATWEYTVAAGDVLSTIAQNQLGSVRRTKEIAELNGLHPPYALRVGQKLKMPAKGSEPAATMTSSVLTMDSRRPASEPEEKPAVITKTRRYLVKPEDMGIVDIAERQLGSQSKWKVIADLNQLEKPFAVTPGQVLLLPE